MGKKFNRSYLHWRYKAYCGQECLFCHSSELDWGSMSVGVETGGMIVQQKISCSSCGAEWQDIYQFKRVLVERNCVLCPTCKAIMKDNGADGYDCEGCMTTVSYEEEG